MGIRYLVLAVFCFGLAHAASRRDAFSNSAVRLSYSIGQKNSTGTGFIFLRPDDPSTAEGPGPVSGKAFLVTNKHVLPPEGAPCNLAIRVTTGSGVVLSIKMLDIPIVGPDGRYLKNVRLHSKNDVAAVEVTDIVVRGGMRTDVGLVPTTLLGTTDRLRKSNVALVGDEIYILGYPAGLFDDRNADPIWRIGIISTSPLLGYAFPEPLQRMFGLPSFVNGFLIDAQVYPGSSGSVVVCKPQLSTFDNPGTVSAGGPGTIPYVLG